METNFDAKLLNYALHQTWLRARGQLFDSKEKTKASGEEVRSFLRNHLDHHLPKSPILKESWLGLADQQKNEALLNSFPESEFSSGKEEEKNYVIEFLDLYDQWFQEILDLVEDKTTLTAEEKEQAQTSLKGLKEELKADAKAGVRDNAQATETERTCFYPFVQQASADLSVSWNSDPIKSKWADNLTYAKLSISHILHDLRNPKEGA